MYNFPIQDLKVRTWNKKKFKLNEPLQEIVSLRIQGKSKILGQTQRKWAPQVTYKFDFLNNVLRN